jgi:hypothetical protein
MFSKRFSSRRRFLLSTVGIAVLFVSCPVLAGYAQFDAATDTIQVSGNSILGTAATIEARINITTTAGGCVFNEWANGYEDKYLGVGSGRVFGFLYHVGGYGALGSSTTISLNTWHHLAYVYDGTQERLYLDGIEVGSRPASGDVLDYAYSIAAVGAIYRDNMMVSSFMGQIDTLRVSTICRYTGESFIAPTGDLTSDSDTNLLYNFNESQGSTVVYDLSGNGRTGTLGAGFNGATSPTLIPEPATMLLLGLGAMGLLRKRK